MQLNVIPLILVIAPFGNLIHHATPQTNSEVLPISFNAKQDKIFIGNVGDALYEDENDVHFTLRPKEIYLPYDTQDVCMANVASAQQDTAPYDDNKNYGGVYEININDLNYEKYRMQNWKTTVQDYGMLSTYHLNNFWGTLPAGLYLKYQKDIPVGYMNGNVLCPIAFADKDNEKLIFYNPSDFKSLLFNDGLYMGKAINGVPFIFYKETKINFPPINYNMGEIFSLHTSNDIDGNKNKIILDNQQLLLTNNFDLSNFICVTGGSYHQKTITIGIDNDFLYQAQQLDSHHKEVSKVLSNYLNNTELTAAQVFIDANMLGQDNINAYLPYKDKPMDAFNFLLNNYSINETNYAKGLGFSAFDNPWPTINKLKNNLFFRLNYQISDYLNKDQWVGMVKDFNLSDLQKGVNIDLHPDQNNDYSFKLIGLNNNCVNNSEVYVGSQFLSNISSISNNIQKVGNKFTLKPQTIANVLFNDVDSSVFSNYFVSQLNDNEVFQLFVQLITNYNEIGDFSMLNSNEYYIYRQELQGQITIYVSLPNMTYSKTYCGFKVPDSNINNMSNTIEQIIASEVDEGIIKQIMLDNHYDPYIVQCCTFSIMKADDQEGEVEVLITSVNDNNLSSFIDQTFLITGFNAFYIRVSQYIETYVLNKKIADVTIDDVKQEILEMSKEFTIRNYDSMGLNINKKNDILTINVTYFNPITTNVEFIINWNVKNNFWTLPNILIIASVAAILLGGGITTFCLIKKKKSNQSARQKVDD